ncbi:YpmS family protein [Streptococcus gallolyticus]|uniref:YpmS family protein n=1 Tax=Streptococcus hepaticus TaxID=3349163 RepID=UPI001C961B45|nr:YpmS family protein [Streptococcus gallolyticus]MBY5040100.1 YpmS family protein [Streptococcus gallolyticus]
MKQKTSGKINGWKWAFLLLLSALIAVSLVLFFRITSSRENTSQIVVSSKKDPKIGTFSTSRDQLNDTIAAYLKDYQKKGFTYKVYATNQLVLFEGQYELFGADIPLYIYFQPSKLEDGSVLLTVTEISAGSLSFPKAEVLSYLQNNYKLPSFISIDIEAATVKVSLSDIKNDLGIYVKANTIDLYNDQILFDLYRRKS